MLFFQNQPMKPKAKIQPEIRQFTKESLEKINLRQQFNFIKNINKSDIKRTRRGIVKQLKLSQNDKDGTISVIKRDLIIKENPSLFFKK